MGMEAESFSQSSVEFLFVLHLTKQVVLVEQFFVEEGRGQQSGDSEHFEIVVVGVEELLSEVVEWSEPFHWIVNVVYLRI